MESVERLPNGLTLRQDDRYFKLGQDSVLLSSFVRIGRRARVLDLGCGTGALALLVWRPDLQVTGLELQPEPAALFARSVEDNGLANVTVRTGDLREIRTLLPHGSVDYVVCNPPYFASGSGRTAAGAAHAAARQDETAKIEDIAAALGWVLPTGGKCGLVFRPERLPALLRALDGRGIAAKRLRFVHQRADTPPSAVLLEGRRGGADGLTVEPPLLVESAEYARIYGKI